MPAQLYIRRVAADALTTFVRNWKRLFLADLVYKILAFVVLTPLVSALFRFLVETSGKTVLADQEILLFLVKPAGWFCLMTVGVLWIAITFAELAALLAIAVTDRAAGFSVTNAITFASANAWRIFAIIMRLVVVTVSVTVPFAAIAAFTYVTLLTNHDINFYLTDRPPAFYVAAAIAVVLVVLLGVVYLRLATGWLLALPVSLFERLSPADSIRASRQRTEGQRWRVAAVIVGWGIAFVLFSAVTTGAVLQVGEWIVPRAASSLPMLTFAIGTCLAAWAVVHLLLNLMSVTTFAVLHFHIYSQLRDSSQLDVSAMLPFSTDSDNSKSYVTRRRLVGAAMLACIFAAGVGYWSLQRVKTDPGVKIIAHRGASQAAPENTMAAIKQAIADGADWVEIDVQETADGEVVVFHDSDFMKLAGEPLKIWDATQQDIERIDIGSWKDPGFSAERVPLLANVLNECRGRCGVVIELKYYGHDQQLEQRVVDIIEATQMVESVMLMSLKADAVNKMKRLRPTWKVGLLMSVAAGNLSAIDVDFLAVNGAFVNRRSISSAQRNNREIYVWTINDAVTMSTLVGRGVDGLITDKPALARTVLAHRADMSIPERMMLELAQTLGVPPEVVEQ